MWPTKTTFIICLGGTRITDRFFGTVKMQKPKSFRVIWGRQVARKHRENWVANVNFRLSRFPACHDRIRNIIFQCKIETFNYLQKKSFNSFSGNFRILSEGKKVFFQQKNPFSKTINYVWGIILEPLNCRKSSIYHSLSPWTSLSGRV
jgi:hypothetical protein